MSRRSCVPVLARLVPLVGLATLVLAGCSGSGGDGGQGPGPTVSIQPGAAALCVGDSVAFSAEVRDGSGNLVSSPQIAWSSSAPQVASIDPARGVAHGLATGTTSITASSGGAVSPAATLDVPSDLLPEFVPDSAVLAPGDTMTLGVRLRRASSGPVPAHVPVITPADGPVATLEATGLVTAKAAGRAPLTLSACGRQGGGAVDVFTPPDSLTGMGYLWLSGASQLRQRLSAAAINFTLRDGHPGFQVYGQHPATGAATRAFVYEDTLTLAGVGVFPVDSVLSDSVLQSAYPCTARRPFASYVELSPVTLLVSLQGGSTAVTSYAPQSEYHVVSGRSVLRLRGLVRGTARVDTLQAIFTFSAPLVDSTNACP